MTIAPMDAIKRVAVFLSGQGYTIVTPPPVPSRLFAIKQGHSLGPFLPFTDYVAVQGLPDNADPATFERMHAATRAYSESQTPLPRALRYRVPNAVTIGVVDSPLTPTLIATVGRARRRSHLDGGSKDSTFLLDLVQESLHGTGIETTPGRYGATTTTSVNPTNRVRRMMEQLAGELFRGDAR